MNLGRIFANAVARRVAYVLVAAALAWLGLGDARADDLGEAWAKCSARTEAHCRSAFGAGFTVNDMRCRDVPSSSNPNNGVVQHQCWRNATEGWRTATQFAYQGTCESRAPHTSDFYPKSGSYRCENGCQTYYYRNSDGTATSYAINATCKSIDTPNECVAVGNIWNPVLWICEPPQPACEDGEAPNSRGECAPEVCPAGMVMAADGTCKTKENECPAGNIKSPTGGCLPGEGQCAQGEARRENGTCGRDSDGDGIADVDDDDPDNDGKESASGGDTCDAPPQCNGGAIDCMQVKIQWRIDCNTRKNRNVSGGACNAPPVCTGDKCDAMEYASLIQQWRAACNLEKLLAGTGTGSNGQPDWTKVTGDGTEGAGTEPAGPVKDREFDPTNRLDDSGFFNGSGTCPSFGVLELPFGATFDLDSKPWACDLFYMTRMFLLMLGTFIALGILMGWKT